MVLLLLTTPIVGVCYCSLFCCALLYVHSSFAIILMGKRELIALLNLSSWCLLMVEWLFLAVPLGCLRFVIVVFPDHSHLLFLLFASKSDILISRYIFGNACIAITCTRGDQKVCGKVLLNRIAFNDCNENS